MSSNEPLSLSPVGTLNSPFTSKFGLPRQPGLIKSAHASITLKPPYNTPDAVRGLEAFSHIWLLFAFDQHLERDWQPLVRPPRLGGNTKIGVFASRSSFRPNHLGMSVVELLRVECSGKDVTLHISCPDILDGTAIYDIKPYLAYVDAVSGTIDGYVQGAPEPVLEVHFSETAEAQLARLNCKQYGDFRALIAETLALDPRPAYKGADDCKLYRMTLYDQDVVWRVCDNCAEVLELRPVAPNGETEA